MMKKYKWSFCFGLLFAPILLTGQFYSAGTDPARVQWRQMNAGKYTIIYPQEIDSLASRYAWLFEKATPYVMKPLRAKTPSIPVILHPYTMFSNGMVVWTPKRMELYTSQPSSSYAQNWEKQLVLHETRHVGQMSNLGQHFFRFAEFIIGQQSQGLASGGFVSKWMLEGDAVVSETEHSFSGRGRQASFLMPYKAYLLDNISFSYNTWRFGSFKYNIPGNYQFGYLLLSTMRSRNQTDFLSDIYEYITTHPYIPAVNAIAFRKTIGQTRVQSWEYATDLMRAIWSEQLVKNGPLTSYQTLIDPVSPPSKWKKPSAAYASYESVTPLSADAVFAVYNNLNRGQALVQIGSDGQKKVLRNLGHISSDLADGGGKLYWTEIVPGLRWEQESFSWLRSYDPKTNILSTLSDKKSRYLFPSVSPLAQKIAAVHAAVTGESFLHILRATDGALVGSYSAPDNGHLQSSVWASESLLYVSVLTDSGLGIYAYNLDSGIWNMVVPHQYQSITRLRFHDGLLWFSSDLNGTDNIYAVNPQTDPVQLFMLTNSKYGAFGPYPTIGALYYSDYSYAGLRPVVAHIDSLKWEGAHFEQPYEPLHAKKLSEQVAFRIDTVSVPDHPPYRSRPYSKTQNLFKVHSWAPVYYDALDNISSLSMEELYKAASPGVMVFSQNTLSTAVTQLGYAYQNGFHAGHLKFIYRGWYPVIELAGDVNDRKANVYKVIKNDDDQWTASYSVSENPSLRASLNLYIPFNLTSGGWVRGFIPKLYLSLRNDRFYLRGEERYDYYSFLQAGMQYYQYRHMTARNIFPRWGFGVSLQAVSVPWMRQAYGSELYTMGYVYLPGVIQGQGIRLKASVQRQWNDGKLYYLSGLASWPRGYNQRASHEYVGLSFDYAVPIWLGDISLGSVLYFKRLQINPFADWAQSKNHLGTERLYSVGADFLLQFHFLRIGSLISAGVRSAYKADGSASFQMLFDVAIQ